MLTDHDTVEQGRGRPRAGLAALSQPTTRSRRSHGWPGPPRRHYGCPQDVEWAVDIDLPEGDNIILLQSRPETVWSKKGPVSVVAPGTKSGDFMSSIVSTLMSPLYTKSDDGS